MDNNRIFYETEHECDIYCSVLYFNKENRPINRIYHYCPYCGEKLEYFKKSLTTYKKLK